MLPLMVIAIDGSSVAPSCAWLTLSTTIEMFQARFSGRLSFVFEFTTLLNVHVNVLLLPTFVV